jgi:hypothetical protein
MNKTATGAPFKYEEKMHSVCYKFPQSMIAALDDLSNRTEVPIVALVRRFVREGLAKQPTQPAA